MINMNNHNNKCMEIKDILKMDMTIMMKNYIRKYISNILIIVCLKNE